MKTTALLVPVLSIGLAWSATSAEAGKKADPTKMTCEEFLGLSEDIQPRAVAFLDGYSKAGKLTEEDIGEVDVDRQMAVLVVACKEEPKKTLWDKVRAHLPGGKKKVKPAKMTCEEYMALDQSVRPEVDYFAEGYIRGTKVKANVAGEVDLERDVAVIYEECKPAPKESLWAKLKKKF
jgi:hypothetical protein